MIESLAFTSTRRTALTLSATVPALVCVRADPKPLPSWNREPRRDAILDFIGCTAKPGGANFVPPEDRIAVFDNDGTLLCEQPAYVQAVFISNRLQALAPQHSEWKTKQPFPKALKGDMKTVATGGEAAVLELVMATRAGTDWRTVFAPA
jgi:hypothetical protein